MNLKVFISDLVNNTALGREYNSGQGWVTLTCPVFLLSGAFLIVT
jgi:hypothetical protein